MWEELSTMDKIKKFFSNKLYLGLTIGGVVLAVAAILLAILLPGGNDAPPVADLTGCTVEVKSEGGRALEGVGVYIYADAAKTDMVDYVRTDAHGVAASTKPVPAGSVAVLDKVPAGYVTAESYPITQAETKITLSTQLLAEMTQVAAGDVMFDFTVTDTNGTEYTLSKLLESKKAVVLNFWYTKCDPCKGEFPFLQQAYEACGDDVVVLAIDPTGESKDDIVAFAAENGLTIPMVAADKTWEDVFDLQAYPTTVIIDRFGTAALIHGGAVEETKVFQDAFAHFTAEDYTQSVVTDIMDLYVEEAEAEEGSAEKPYEFGGVTEFEVTVPAGGEAYCDVYKVSGMQLKIEDAAAKLSYNGKEYLPEEGVIALVVTAEDTFTPVKLVIGNTAQEEKTFKVTFAFLPGTMSNPLALALGDVTVDIEAGNNQGIYYTYKAEQDGVLTLKCNEATEGVEYDYALYNLTSYEYLTFAESEEDFVAIAVKAGEEIQFSVSTLPNDENEYPAAQLKFTASFGEGEPEETQPEETKPQGGTTGGNQGSTGGNQGSTGGNQGSTGGNQGSTGGNQGSTGGNQGTTGGNQGSTDTTPKQYTELYVGKAQHVFVGTNTVSISGSDVNYFVFEPQQSGKYKVSVDASTLSYYGNNTAFIQDLSNTVGCNGKSFSVNIKEGHLGSIFILGIKGSGTVKLTIERTGAAELDFNDLPWNTYAGTSKPTSAYTYTGGSLTRVDITGATTSIVYGDDGYYHLGSATGPVIYVNLDDETYLSFNSWLTSDYPVIRAVTGSGSSAKKWDFTSCISAYNKFRDRTKDVYPMTEDLKFMLEALYEHCGWGDPDMAYLFDDVSGLNEDMAWLFCCYYEAQ